MGTVSLAKVLGFLLRGLIIYCGVEALGVTLSGRDDARFAGKGIAIRNALIIGAFSLLLPALHRRSGRRRPFPWGADALLLSIPALDMAGNSLNLYNRSSSFDVLAHFYGSAATAALFHLVVAGSGVRSSGVRWVAAVGGSTLFHVMLEAQEYWTDVVFGTQNVFGLEDTEGDLLAGLTGAISGAIVSELAMGRSGNGRLASEAELLASALETVP